MNAQAMTVNRNLSENENYSGRAIRSGETVYLYRGCTYGCISIGGIAVTFFPDENPFFQIPDDSLSIPAENEPEQARR